MRRKVRSFDSPTRQMLHQQVRCRKARQPAHPRKRSLAKERRIGLIRLAAQAARERPGTFPLFGRSLFRVAREGLNFDGATHIYLIGLIVVVMAILSFFGLR